MFVSGRVVSGSVSFSLSFKISRKPLFRLIRLYQEVPEALPLPAAISDASKQHKRSNRCRVKKKTWDPIQRNFVHGNLRGPPQCHPPPENKALLRDY